MRADNQKSFRVAMGGVSSGLCLFLMFLTGMIPFASYALPAFAGIVLIAMVVENGAKAATVAYGAVALLSIFIVPDKEAACLFIFFFGYYPIAKFFLDRITSKVLGYGCKLLLFNLAVVAAYLVVIYLFGLTEILEAFGPFGEYSALVLLAFGNVFFFVYDHMVGTLIDVYIQWFRPKFLRR